MADDSASQNLPQNNQTDPTIPSDQLQSPPEATSSSSIGQQPSEWPNSTILANADSPADSSPSDLANDQPIAPVSPPPVSVEEKPLEVPVVPEPPEGETPPQAVSSEIGQSASSDNTWPDSTKMAYDNPTDTSNLANFTSPTDQPVVSTDSSPPSADSTQSSADSPIPSIPPVTPAEPVSSVPAESPPSLPSPLSPSNISAVPTLETPPPQVGQPEPSEATSTSDSSLPAGEAGNPSDLGNPPPISVSPPDIQPISDQPEAPNDTSNIDTEKTPDQLASFNPEPPEQSQEAPLANNDSQNSTPRSFGDLLSPSVPDTQVSSSPPLDQAPVSSIPPSSPVPPISPTNSSISFGDLIKDIEITPPSIPEAERPVEQSSQNQPSPLPPQPQPPSPSQSAQSFPSPSLVIDQNEMQKQFEEKSKAKLVENRIKANQVRSQKKKDHLDKIMELVRNTKTITNTDTQRLLHVSQSTATNYLAELSSRGMLKREGIRGGAKYTL